MEYEIIIVGGGFAGHAAALHLGRARRRVLLVDSGEPRNRFARFSHGFLGQDGQPPSAITAAFRLQIASYATVSLREGRVTGAEAISDGFRVALADGDTATCARMILAMGVKDGLPSIPGIEPRWGVSVLHCPYCHGYELNQGPLGVLATSEMAIHQSMLVRDWGPTTLFAQGAITPTPEQQAMLDARGVTVELTPVAELLGPGPELEAVRLADGRTVALSGLFLAPNTAPSSDLAAQLGCDLKDGPTGPIVAVDERQATSLPGVFAAGDVASPMANATLAAAGGIMAASAAHHSLIYGVQRQEG